MKRILANFMGKHGSMGYKFGHRYQLDIVHDEKTGTIWAFPVKGYDSKAKPCEYSTIVTFLDNWDGIINIGIVTANSKNKQQGK